ncbi:MAG TPA: AI-2E family transporter [Candidatus Saccharimonadales bacterium]|jgi:predicted PurR-regulated permease PerM|nr:AI-2E family transporter [Candidatus Saccharimonadales bacterium]
MAHFFKEKEHGTQITVSNQTVLRVVALVIAAFIVLLAIRQASHALLLIFTAFFLSLALNGPVHWLAVHFPGRLRGSRTLATAVSYLIVIVILGAFIASLVPPLIRQTNSFISAAPHLIEQTRSQNSAVGKFIRDHHLQNQVNELSTQLSDRLKNASGTAVSTVTQVGSSVFSLLAILALTFMMLVEGPHWLELFKRLIPHHQQEHAHKLAIDMYKVVKGYVNGQVILAALASCFITPALFILHVPYPVALIFIVFVCGLIPMVGHTIGAIIVSTVALFHSLPSALILLAYYILYQQIENYLIQPRIQANSTNMSPLLVFASVIIGVNFGGLFGGLVAIPVAGCIRIAVLDYLENRHFLSKQSFDNLTTEKRG